jgi:hypothetical protein
MHTKTRDVAEVASRAVEKTPCVKIRDVAEVAAPVIGRITNVSR